MTRRPARLAARTPRAYGRGSEIPAGYGVKPARPAVMTAALPFVRGLAAGGDGDAAP